MNIFAFEYFVFRNILGFVTWTDIAELCEISVIVLLLCVGLCTDEAAGYAKPRCVGHEGETVLHRGRNPSMGHCVFCASEDC